MWYLVTEKEPGKGEVLLYEGDTHSLAELAFTRRLLYGTVRELIGYKCE